jgi:outer membrane protein assembly factor BamB
VAYRIREAWRWGEGVEAVETPTAWPEFGGGPRNRGVGQTDATTTDRLRWTFETDSEVRSSPAVADGTVYVGSDDGRLYALDAATGECEWTFQRREGLLGSPVDERIRSSPTVDTDAETVYVGSTKGYLYALGTAEGTERWRYETEGKVNHAPAIADGVVYVPRRSQYDDDVESGVVAIDGDSGEQLWVTETSSDPWTSPVVEENTVYFGTYSRKTHAVATDGTPKWEFKADDVVRSVAASDDTVFAGSDDGRLYALDATTGEREWAFETAGPVKPSPAVVDGLVIVGDDDANVYGVDAETGTSVWSTELDRRMRSSPAVVDGTVYFGSRNSLRALDVATGEPTWSYKLGWTVNSSPTVLDGTVYVGCDDNSVYALLTDP